MTCRAIDGHKLSDTIRDFKKFTSKKIIELIKEEPESRREWFLMIFKDACSHLKRDQQYKVKHADSLAHIQRYIFHLTAFL